jgi:hypothetical protein
MVEQTLEAKLQDAVAKYTKSGEQIGKFANGGDTETVDTDNGPVPTLSKIVKDNTDIIAASRAELDNKVSQASISATAAEQSKSDAVQSNTDTINYINSFKNNNLPVIDKKILDNKTKLDSYHLHSWGDFQTIGWQGKYLSDANNTISSNDFINVSKVGAYRNTVTYDATNKAYNLPNFDDGLIYRLADRQFTSDYQSFEMQIGFEFESIGSSFTSILGIGDLPGSKAVRGFILRVLPDGKLQAYASSNGSWDIFSSVKGVTSLQANTKYIANVKHDITTNNFTVKISSDNGLTWNTEISTNTALKLNIPDQCYLEFGLESYDFPSSIITSVSKVYAENSFFKLDNVLLAKNSIEKGDFYKPLTWYYGFVGLDENSQLVYETVESSDGADLLTIIKDKKHIITFLTNSVGGIGYFEDSHIHSIGQYGLKVLSTFDAGVVWAEGFDRQEITLWSGSIWSGSLNLIDDISNYSEVQFLAWDSYSGFNAGTVTYPTSYLKNAPTGRVFYVEDTGNFRVTKNSNIKLTVQYANHRHLHRVYGIR